MNYTKEEKESIFDIVNSTHLHLCGKDRSDVRRNFMAWKQNKSIGAFELFIKLYESEDVYDKKIQFYKDYINDQGPFWNIYLNKEPMPFSKYQLHMKWKDEEIEETLQLLEDIKEGKGYISEESHNELIEELKNDKEEIIREQGNTIGKLRNENLMLREKYEASERRLEAAKRFYEASIDKVISMRPMD